MPRLPMALAAWNTPDFEGALKREIEATGAGWLPLQQGLSSSSYALDDNISAMIIGVSDEPGCIRARVGIFYSGIIAGCSCADDPTPVEAQAEYCEVRLAIDKATAQTAVTALVDPP